jgi:hypothetical protein
VWQKPSSALFLTPWPLDRLHSAECSQLGGVMLAHIDSVGSNRQCYSIYRTLRCSWSTYHACPPLRPRTSTGVCVAAYTSQRLRAVKATGPAVWGVYGDHRERGAQLILQASKSLRPTHAGLAL